ncbi:MAG: response regulator [Candidatus Kerfeldbacteria bacterium]|nr:response regulator [Candidatus Kerfeldbacteria bacterium]
MTPTKNNNDQPRAKLLLIEDDTFLAGMYVTKLTLESYQAELATDGKSGLEKAKKLKPDLILLDILLPKMNGFDVLRALKKDAATKNIPVILLTNLGQKDDVVKGLELGAADYLIKAHFMPSEVIAKIAEVLKQQGKHGRD